MKIESNTDIQMSFLGLLTTRRSLNKMYLNSCFQTIYSFCNAKQKSVCNTSKTCSTFATTATSRTSVDGIVIKICLLATWSLLYRSFNICVNFYEKSSLSFLSLWGRSMSSSLREIILSLVPSKGRWRLVHLTLQSKDTGDKGRLHYFKMYFKNNILRMWSNSQLTPPENKWFSQSIAEIKSSH
mgnify:CR=1 FL=1